MLKSEISLSVVIPVYNGASSISELVHAIADIDIPGGHEVILAIDGSPDNSLYLCLNFIGNLNIPITVLDLARNFGEHNAVMAGLTYARGKYIVIMDDDLQNPPAEVLRLYQFIVAEGVDVVYTRYASKMHSVWRNLGSRFTNWVADILLDKPKGIYLSSFKIISSFVANEIIKYSGPYPYIDGLIFQVTKNIGILSVEHLERPLGHSNYTIRRLIHLWLAMFLNFSVLPLRVATLIGISLSALGGIGVMITILDVVFSNNTPRGYPSLMASLLLLSGVQLLMLGLIGEYLGRLYLTANHKPQYVIRNIFGPHI